MCQRKGVWSKVEYYFLAIPTTIKNPGNIVDKFQISFQKTNKQTNKPTVTKPSTDLKIPSPALNNVCLMVA